MRYLWFLLLLLPLALSPFPYYLTLLNFFALSAMVALSLYVLTGLAGMTSFAQAAFMGMGAYATALLTVKAGLSPWLGLGAGLLSALLLALLLGALTVRLKGHFLPLSTIAWQVALYILAAHWDHIPRAVGEILSGAFNPAAAEGVMCRTLLSVGWDGRIYDCDFNQMLGWSVNHGVPTTIWDFDVDKLLSRQIVFGDHCYGCTAGAGSSCGGAVVK